MSRQHVISTALALGLALTVSGCGDGSSSSDGPKGSWVDSGGGTTADTEALEELTDAMSESPSDPAESSESSESPESPSEAPSETTTPEEPGAIDGGYEMKGDGYTVQAPQGWGPAPQGVVGFDPDVIAFDLEDDQDGFMDNLNVLVIPDELPLDQAEQAARTGLKSIGAKGLEIHDNVSVGGVESVHASASTSVGSVGYLVDQFYVSREGSTFIVTISASEGTSLDDRAGVWEAVLGSWAWKG